MRNFILTVMILLSPFICQSQDAYRISFDMHQLMENGNTSIGNQIKLPTTNSTVILGGLNNWDGTGNYFNIFGSKLLIDSLDIAADGTRHVVLRREDGRNFYDLFPTLKAKLTPVLSATSDDSPLNN